MAISLEDEQSRPRGKHQIGEDLSTLSLYELESRISDLRKEIERIQDAVKSKSVHKQAADRLFGGR